MKTTLTTIQKVTLIVTVLFATIFFTACDNQPASLEQVQKDETVGQTASSVPLQDTIVLINTDSLIEKITDEKSWQAARYAAYSNRQLLRAIAYDKKQKVSWLAYHEKDSICQSIWRERTSKIETALEILKFQSRPAYDAFISAAGTNEDFLSWMTLEHTLLELEKTMPQNAKFIEFANYCRQLSTAAMNEQDKIGQLMLQKQNVAGAEMLSVQTHADNQMLELQVKADQKWISIKK